jgi:hypothetical protein
MACNLHTITDWVEALPHMCRGLKLYEVLHLTEYEVEIKCQNQPQSQEEIAEHTDYWRRLWINGSSHTGAV